MSEHVMRAKFVCQSVTLNQYGGEQVQMYPVCQDETEENKRFHQASPGGELKLFISNPNLAGAVKPGDTLYVDFHRAPL